MRILIKRSFASAAAANKPYNILFFGSDDFSKATLTSLLHNKNPEIFGRVAVASPGAGSTGSPTDLFHRFLKDKSIEKYTFRSNLNAVEKYIKEQMTTREQPFDLGIIASFPRLLPESVLTLFPKGVLVAHPALVPNYRGPAAIEHTVLNNEKTGGVSILVAEAGNVAGGQVLMKKEYQINPTDGYLELAEEYGRLAGKSLAEILTNLDGFLSKGTEQKVSDSDLAAPFIKKEDAMFLWDKLSVEKAVRKQMALFGSIMPGFAQLKLGNKWTYVHFDKLRPETDTSSEYYQKTLAPVDDKATPGVIHWNQRGAHNKICIRCTDGWVSTDRMKVDKVRATTVETFITKQLRDEHFNLKNKFVHKFADSNDVALSNQKLKF